MREIKFRVWDNVDYMSTPFTLEDVQERKILFTIECPVMQYIGLPDKEGTEIYEGDILESESGYRFEVAYVDAMGGFACKEIVDKKRELFFGRIMVPLPLRKHIADNMVVIGNIYESHDLIKQL